MIELRIQIEFFAGVRDSRRSGDANARSLPSRGAAVLIVPRDMSDDRPLTMGSILAAARYSVQQLLPDGVRTVAVVDLAVAIGT